VLSFNRASALDHVLDLLERLPLEEVIVVDNASTGDSVAVARRHGDRVRVLQLDENVGIAARNIAVRAAGTELVVLLDDDSYPLPGAIQALRAAFEQRPRLAVVGGYVEQVDLEGRVAGGLVHAFDWFLGRRKSDDRPDGTAAFFFPEGAAMVRRSAFLEVGGFFEPGFLTVAELDLTTRLVGAGYDVRYLAAARFHHLAAQEGRTPGALSLRYKVRNQIWYFWLRFPISMAARRIPAYLAFDLVEAVYRRQVGAWAGGISDAWRQRGRVRHERRPLPRPALRRAELDRGRLHLRLLPVLGRAWLSRRLARRDD
jgi:GT2 family glycosyltransferase